MAQLEEQVAELARRKEVSSTYARFSMGRSNSRGHGSIHSPCSVQAGFQLYGTQWH